MHGNLEVGLEQREDVDLLIPHNAVHVRSGNRKTVLTFRGTCESQPSEHSQSLIFNCYIAITLGHIGPKGERAKEHGSDRCWMVEKAGKGSACEYTGEVNKCRMEVQNI